MNTYLRVFAFLSLVTFSFAFGVGKCGTERPTPVEGLGTSDKSIPACGKHECDDPAVRNTYLVGPDTPVTTINLNVIYFGNLSGTAKTQYDAQMAFFKQEYKKFFKIEWNINVTVVTDRYQAVDTADKSTLNSIAAEFYLPGFMTLIWTTFDPNTDNLLGFAYSPQAVDVDTEPQMFYCMMDIAGALTPTGTTVLHEIGHMFGLYHPFIELSQRAKCDSCVENMNAVNRDTLGDFCNDTLPVPMSFACNALSNNNTDCNNNMFTDLTGLPQNNYMAYTPDSCQNEFTAQQGARARCYLDRVLRSYIASTSVAPIASTTPSSNAPQSSGNTPVRTPNKVSGGTRAAQAVASLALLGLLAL